MRNEKSLKLSVRGFDITMIDVELRVWEGGREGTVCCRAC